MNSSYCNKKIPIARCPECNHSIVYSSKGTDKNTVDIQIAPHDYGGRTILCAKCKSMLIVTYDHIQNKQSNLLVETLIQRR